MLIFFSVSLRDSIRGPLERQARAQTAMLCRSPELNKVTQSIHVFLYFTLVSFTNNMSALIVITTKELQIILLFNIFEILNKKQIY